MKFALGFIVGALVGKPVINMVARRIDLVGKIQTNVAVVVFDVADRLADGMDRRSQENDPKKFKSWRVR